MTRPLPQIATRNLLTLTKFVRAVKPNATDITFPDQTHDLMHWNVVTFNWRGEPGVATLGLNYPDELACEWPYRRVLQP